MKKLGVLSVIMLIIGISQVYIILQKNQNGLITGEW